MGNHVVGAPKCCGCKCCFNLVNCGYVSLAPVKAAASGATALFLVAAQLVKTDQAYRALLALALVMMMLTATFVLGRNVPVLHGAHDVEKPDLEKPLVDDAQDVATDKGQAVAP